MMHLEKDHAAEEKVFPMHQFKFKIVLFISFAGHTP
jgi:hypothetical protein